VAKTFLVTGASRGLGLEFARQLTARGDSVIATVRNPDRAGDLARMKGVRVVALDAADPRSIDRLREAVGPAPIDVLINNAGVSSTSKNIATLDPAELQSVFMVNSIAPMLVTKSLLANLRAGARKTVIQITSQLGSIAKNTGGSTYAYRASKAALNQLNRSLANELGPDGFTCIALHPGWVRTDMGGPRGELAVDESIRHMLRTIDALTPAKNGAFLSYDGSPIPW